MKKLTIKIGLTFIVALIFISLLAISNERTTAGTNAGSTNQISGSYVEPYNRKKHFGSWIDADKDGQNTRAEVLIDESLVPVTFTDSSKRIVLWGKWICPLTGHTFTNAKDVDVDHVVPLKEAWVSGASAWTREKRVLFANDLTYEHHLIAVDRAANREKGASDPALWMPDNKSFTAEYIKIWLAIKSNWNLSAAAEESKAIKTYLNNNN